MRYAVIKHTDLQKLVKKINEDMQDGWEPIGGISRTGDSFDSDWVQAMVQDVEPSVYKFSA